MKKAKILWWRRTEAYAAGRVVNISWTDFGVFGGMNDSIPEDDMRFRMFHVTLAMPGDVSAVADVPGERMFNFLPPVCPVALGERVAVTAWTEALFGLFKRSRKDVDITYFDRP